MCNGANALSMIIAVFLVNIQKYISFHLHHHCDSLMSPELWVHSMDLASCPPSES